jgi:hypothetical protein
LEAIYRHLEQTGRLALHLFDPRLDLLIDANTPLPELSGIHPETGRRYMGKIVRTNFDHLNQVRRDVWRYTEIGPNGEGHAEDIREMACVGPIVGNCIICSDSVASQSRRSTAILIALGRLTARN